MDERGAVLLFEGVDEIAHALVDVDRAGVDRRVRGAGVDRPQKPASPLLDYPHRSTSDPAEICKIGGPFTLGPVPPG